MLNYYYSDSIEKFLSKEIDTIIGEISRNARGQIETELVAWTNQINILKEKLTGFKGEIYFEFSIPRMGKRVDCLLIIRDIVFVLEFKVGAKIFLTEDIDQVWDYALDLKNFHLPSREVFLVPILIATDAENPEIELTINSDKLIKPICTNADNIDTTINRVLDEYSEKIKINDIVPIDYIRGVYSPTPTIIEAAIKLFNNHNVDDITRNDASVYTLKSTCDYISETITYAKTKSKKIICFVTGVPGAGKTLVGLKVATTKHLDEVKGDTSVFLSGNKPLVDVLQEALTRDKVLNEKNNGKRLPKKEAKRSVKAFIQMIHHYRDAYIVDKINAPYDHVAIFDEAQRAWNKEQTKRFMHQKKGIPNFDFSEPEFLISCLDRHTDWAVIVCLVGGGQEINTGEGGISEWLNAIIKKFTHWETRISENLNDSEYMAKEVLKEIDPDNLVYNKNLHLAISMRSFRAENLSKLVKEILDIDNNAEKTFNELNKNYPLFLTRDLNTAKNWLKTKARGSERYGIVVSSQAYRLKPFAIDVKSPINHIYWFLNGKEDVRSSFYLEDVATEFQVQGLELDWVCMAWDGDLRFSNENWKTYSFKGTKWHNILKEERKKYLINSYRVLLTRARQGLIIYIPSGDSMDNTRLPEYYDSTFKYLSEIIGITVV